METNLSEEERRSNQTKSKLQSLSGEDLIRFVKKQLDNARQSEVEAGRLRGLLEEKELVIKELLTENATLKQKSDPESICFDSVSSSDKALLNDTVSTECSGSLVERNTFLESQISQLKKDLARSDDDLAAAIQVNNALRFQLDNALQEAIALREERTASDVFSLELKDYEKKMVQLNKSLKDAEVALETSNTEKEKLIQELDTHKVSSDRMKTECKTLQQELEEVRNELYGEQCRVRELTSTMDKLQNNSDILMTVRNEERVSLEAKIARNEELLAYWQRNSEQKSAELSELLAENQMLKTRCENLEGDFHSYKLRARYVLEQQAKAVENDTASKQLGVENLPETLKKVMEDLEELHNAHKLVINDSRKYRDQCMKYESVNRSAKARADELQSMLGRTNDELWNCSVMLKLRTSDCVKYQSQVNDLEKKLHDETKEKEKALQSLEEHIASRSAVEAEFVSELKKERSRCEEAMRLLGEAHKERAQFPPDSPIRLRRSVSEHLTESSPAAKQCPNMTASNFSTDDVQCSSSLEDVLFGEDFMDPGSSNTAKTLSSLMHENEQLLKHLHHIRDLLKDSEATNATLIDQSVLLKEEIRRLERNEERLSHFENSEYLKNIIVKFLSPERVSGERVQLVPILTTMLRLSPDETELLNRAAAQDEVAHGESENTWGSYLRWGRLN